MKIIDINIKTNHSGFCVKIENDVVYLSHWSDCDLGYDEYSLFFELKDYENGIIDLIRTKSCKVIGKTSLKFGREGSIEIELEENNFYRIIITTPRGMDILEQLDVKEYKFYE